MSEGASRANAAPGAAGRVADGEAGEAYLDGPIARGVHCLFLLASP